jgi:hypothetical protein
MTESADIQKLLALSYLTGIIGQFQAQVFMNSPNEKLNMTPNEAIEQGKYDEVLVEVGRKGREG